MRRFACCGFLVVALAASSPSADAQDNFTQLFNGKDLTGWKPYLRPTKDNPNPDPKDTWSVEGRVIRCTGKPNGYIATEKEYGNYILRLKWRYPAGGKGGNSGVLLHVTGPDRVWPNSVEAQLASGQAGDFWLIGDESGRLPALEIDQSRKDPKNKEGRHYFRINREKPVEKPLGEWNQYEITCKDGNVTLVINGTLVNEGKNGELKRGRIALQSEGAPIEFQDIEIKELK